MTTRWKQNLVGAYTSIDWSDWSKRQVPIDPYLVWADICGASGFAAPDPADAEAGAKWPLIIELSAANLPIQVADGNSTLKVPWIFGCMEVAAAYLREEEETGNWLVDGKFITANVRPDSIEHLLCSTAILRFQLGIARIPRYQFGAIEPGLQPPVERLMPRVVVGIIDDGCPFAHPSFADSDSLTRVHCLWDQDHRRASGGPCLPWHKPASLGYGGELSRSALLEAATYAAFDDLEPYRRTQYGSFKLDPYTISSSPLDAESKPNPLPQLSQRAGSHGSSVMALAVGYPSVLRSQAAPLHPSLETRPRKDFSSTSNLQERIKKIEGLKLSLEDTVAVNTAIGILDTADQWPIVFVQLPTRTVADTTGGSLAVHVLDAVRYILLKAFEIPYENYTGTATEFRDNAVVINLSWGALGGAHDGSSILERALLELTESENQDLTIVAASGNAHRAEHHAQVVLAPGDSATFHWVVGPDNPLESYLELWLPDRDIWGTPISDRLEQELGLSLTDPSGEKLPFARMGDIWLYDTIEAPDSRAKSRSAGPSAGLFFFKKVAQSEIGTMVLVALSPTRQQGPDSRHPAPHGEWLIEVSWGSPGALSGPPVTIQAWCERNDLIFGSRRTQQARVSVRSSRRELSEHDPEAMRAWRQRNAWVEVPRGFEPRPSLSSITGTPQIEDPFPAPSPKRDLGGHLLVVGGYRMADGEMSPDSSGGPQRSFSVRETVNALNQVPVSNKRVSPDADAPSDASIANPGLRTYGNRSFAAIRISGTSAAAAIATRGLANILYWKKALAGIIDAEKTIEKIISLVISREVSHEISAASRATLTPRGDDAFRKGRRRFR